MDEGLSLENVEESSDRVLRHRYELGERIGRGGQGVTTLARDRQTGESVVVKELHLAHLDEWKKLELFEREGEALQSLNHPAIPAYVDHFHIDEDTSSRLYLVQEYVDGIDLARALERGLRLTEAQAIVFIDELLEILVYIHSRTPPIIHRDIKPSNVMRRKHGTLVLVDFGAARSLLEEASEGSTVVGTSGYMPLEQLTGSAFPATDIYAVGVTAIHLLSHTHPADMDVVNMKLQFRGDVAVSDELKDFLEKMIAPHVEDRFQSAQQALEALRSVGAQQTRGRIDPDRTPASPVSLPEAGLVKQLATEKWMRVQDGDVVVLRAVPRIRGEGLRMGLYVAFVFFALLSLNLIGSIVYSLWNWLISTEMTHLVSSIVTLVPTFFALLFTGLTAASIFGYKEFRLGPRSIVYRSGVLGFARTRSIDISAIQDIELVEPANRLPDAPAGLRIKMEFDDADFDALDDVKGTRRVADEIKAHVARSRV